MGLSPRLLRPQATGFNPKSISGLALWLDASDAATLFQDAAATTPATASSDPVGAWLDKSGNARHVTQATAGNRPTISATAQNGRKQLAIAATNSSLSTAALSLPAPFSVIAVVQKASRGINTFFGSGDNTNYQFGDGSTLYSGSYYGASRVAGAVYGAAPIATGRAQVFSATAVSGSLPASLSMWSDGIGGVAQTITAGTSPNNTFGGPVQVGATSSTPWGGTVCEMIAYSKALSTFERQRLERYLAAKWGITIAPQVSNADAQDWINRVYANSGTVSASTAAAVNTFCTAIDSAGIRDRFYRLNLFCGGTSGASDGLAACLVPLYRGPSLGGTQYGSTTDANNGPFVVGDYAETGASGGLVPGASNASKYLNTGLTPAAAPVIATGHLSAYLMSGFSASTIYGVVSALGAGFANNYSIELNRGAAGYLYGAWGEGGSFTPLATPAQAGVGHTIVSRTGGTSLNAYKNGSLAATSTTAVTPTTHTANWFVGANNLNGSPANYFSGRIGAYSIGAGLDDTQAAAFSAAMIAFQTALTRNV